MHLPRVAPCPRLATRARASEPPQLTLQNWSSGQRAHAQQTQWFQSRCFRDAREAAAAGRGAKGRLAKGAAPGCERLDATVQLRLELGCVRSCRLRVDSSAEALQQCMLACGRVLRAALSIPRHVAQNAWRSSSGSRDAQQQQPAQ